MQEAAIRHGTSIPEYKPPENTGWFVCKHHIEYLSPAFLGNEMEVRTWASEMKRVWALRKYEFVRKADERVLIRGETQFILVDRRTRPIPIPPEIQALFPTLAGTTD